MRVPGMRSLKTITGPARRTGGMNLAIFTIFRSVMGREEQVKLPACPKATLVTY